MNFCFICLSNIKKSSVVFLLLLLVFFAKAGFSQTWSLQVTPTVTDGKKRMDGAVVVLLKNGKEANRVVTDKSGKADFKLEPDNDFLIKFTKPGYVSKSIRMDTRNVPADDIMENMIFRTGPEVELFQEVEGLDVSILDQPIGILVYDNSMKDFSYDMEYTKSIQVKVQEMLRELEQKKKEEAAKNAKYTAAISRADKAFNARDYENAKNSYNEAVSVKPKETYPKEKLSEIAKLQGDEDARKKTEADRSSKEKENNEKYTAAIAKADRAFASKDFSAAKGGYNEAINLKPAEQYPKNKLQEIDRLLGEEEARKKADAEKSSQQKQIDEKYNTAVIKADKAFGAKDYGSAKSNYNEALGIKPSEQYPKTKLNEIDKLLADEQALKKADADKDKKNNEKYNSTIAKADNAFGLKDYVSARSLYNEALGIKPTEQYPKTKIQEIDKIFADEDARKKSEADRLAKEKSIGDKYAAAIARADQLFQSKEYNASKFAYNEALSIKSTEKYPKERIAEIEKLIAENAAREAAGKLGNQKYQDAINKADKFFALKDYLSAKGNYNEALKIKPNEKYPSDKIVEIDKIIANQKATVTKAEPTIKQVAPEIPKGKDEKQKYLNDLARKYPQGITEEVIEDKDQRKTVTRRIVVNGTEAHEYQRIVYSFATYYTKNGDNITIDTWNKETEK
jgi:hypothetical protein